jgi:hypothetical protein
MFVGTRLIIRKLIVLSSQRRGGRDLKQISPKASLSGAAGVVRNVPGHPVCAVKGSSRYFFDAQPPLLFEEGTTGREMVFSI